MTTSLGRRLYNLSSRRETRIERPRPARPAGPLIWLLAPSAGAISGLSELARQLCDAAGPNVVFSGAVPPDPQARGQVAGLIHEPAPADNTADVRAFLDHWQPELLVISGGEIRPALLHEAANRSLPVVLVDAASPSLPRGRDGWFPGLMRESLASLRQVMALDEAAARTYQKSGASMVSVTGRLEEPSAVLPCLETERAALAALMATRPIWLAADVTEAEEAAVVFAHRSALRLAHRLLLILVPQDPGRASVIASQLQASEGWNVAQRGLEQEPLADVEVYIPDGAAEYGLWYRLSPITFLGGSLAGSGVSRNPMEPAALGSAILHGPRPGAHAATLGRLGAARAARAVGSPGDLAEALGDLLSPDRAAQYAQAAWLVSSEGAEHTDQVLGLIRRILDGKA